MPKDVTVWNGYRMSGREHKQVRLNQNNRFRGNRESSA